MDPVEVPGVHIQFREWTCKLVVGRYVDPPNIALTLVDPTNINVPMAHVTINTDVRLAPGQVAIKDYNENHGMVAVMQAAGVIAAGPPMGMVQPGYVPIGVYKLLIPDPPMLPNQ